MHLLVITNESVEGDALHDAIQPLGSGPGDEVTVVAPGAADPLQAIADALAVTPADELLIAETAANRLDGDLMGRACARFDLPVAHVLVAA